MARYAREPLVDIISKEGEINVVAEIPSVDKECIKVTVTENSITMDTDASNGYHKETELPDAVDPSSARSSYRNGVLSITFKIKNKEGSGVSIRVE